MSDPVVFMGVAGCGKSTVAAAVAQALGLRLVEGDDFHSASNRRKMSQGIALTDEDRDAWLTTLSQELRNSPRPMVLTCSALKRKYRDRLRQAAPGLRFVFLELSQQAAQARVSARSAHFCSADLVHSQFAALESPVGEAHVLCVDATKQLGALTPQVIEWLETSHA